MVHERFVRNILQFVLQVLERVYGNNLLAACRVGDYKITETEFIFYGSP